MSKKTKIILMVLAAIYCISPIDIIPGIPVDDVVALVSALAVSLISGEPKVEDKTIECEDYEIKD